MMSFRFETYENVLSKHYLPKISWAQAAHWAFTNNFNKGDWTVASIKQLDNDTVEIIKRKDFNKSICYKLGWDQKGVYERVIVNRKDKSVAVDRLDINWLSDAPFLGRRDLFFPSKKHENTLDFVRHDFWLHKLLKFDYQVFSHFSAWSYKRAFKNTEYNQ